MKVRRRRVEGMNERDSVREEQGGRLAWEGLQEQGGISCVFTLEGGVGAWERARALSHTCVNDTCGHPRTRTHYTSPTWIGAHSPI